jgi:hypothetical protein
VLPSKTIPLLAAGALVVSACGDDGGDDGGGDKVAVGDFASDICTAFTDRTNAIREGQTELQKRLEPTASPSEQKDALAAFLDDALAANDQLVEDLDAAGVPDTKNGEEVAEAVQAAAEGARERLADARDEVDDLPTESPQAFEEAAGDFRDELGSALEGLGAGITEVDTPELEKALGEESACQS